MPILSELLEQVKSSELDEQVKRLCDVIFEEEKDKIKHIDDLPVGPNIFLGLEVPGRSQGEIAFVALERETKEKYIVSLWVKGPPSSVDRPARRIRAIEVGEVKAEKILLSFAETYKQMRGE
jgi:hypothetical protein